MFLKREMIENISFLWCSLLILLETRRIYCAGPYESIIKGDLITKFKTVNILQQPSWLDRAVRQKGSGQDRQHLGIILGSGQTIKVRQTNEAFTDLLTLRFLNDNCKTETSLKFTNDWEELTATAAAVPFIDTPYGDIKPMVEYAYLNNVKTLPVYRKGDNQSTFFDLWDSQKSEFALVENEFVIILVPAAGKTELNSLNIDELLANYESIFSFYNELAGLSSLPQTLTDQNSNERFFLKTDKGNENIFGSYCGLYLSEGNFSANTTWLNPFNNVNVLRSIGFGYSIYFRNDRYLNNDELWGNVYAASYQKMATGEYQDKQDGLPNLIAQSKPLNEWNRSEKLTFLIMLIEKAGIKAFAHFCQQCRFNRNPANFQASERNLLDMLSESFSVAGYQVDVTPFVELVRGYISPVQRERNLLSQAKAVYPLNQLVQGKALDTLLLRSKVLTAFSLVNAEELQVTGMKGNVKLHLKIDDFSQIYGEYLFLMDGVRRERRVLIMQPDILLEKVPIGVYVLRLPTGKNKKYRQQATYLVVTADDSTHDVVFERKNVSSILNQKINFLGYGNNSFSTVEFNWNKKLIAVDVFTDEPQPYFHDLIYAKIMVHDKRDALRFNKTIMGITDEISHDDVPFAIGDKIEIYHAEPNRLRLNPDSEGVIDTTSKTNTLLITAFGLINVELNNDPSIALMHRIEESAKIVRGNYKTRMIDFNALNDIYLAIDSFSSPQREKLMKNYSDCTPANNAAPDDKQGNVFNFIFKGISDWEFLTAELNLLEKQFVIKHKGGVPHYYFDNTYAALRYLDNNGKELLNLDIIGKKSMDVQTWTLPISGQGGEIIHLRHLEADTRLFITNEMQQLRVADRGTRQSYYLARTGLVRIEDFRE